MDEAEGLLGELREALTEWARTSHAPVSQYVNDVVLDRIARCVVLMLSLYDEALSFKADYASSVTSFYDEDLIF